MLSTVINGALGVTWLVLMAGSIYIFLQGRRLYRLVKTGLIGKFSKTFVLATVVQMYSLGIVATVLIVLDKSFITLVIPVFVVLLGTFWLSVRAIKRAMDEVDKLSG